jgi:hypothetical protein
MWFTTIMWFTIASHQQSYGLHALAGAICSAHSSWMLTSTIDVPRADLYAVSQPQAGDVFGSWGGFLAVTGASTGQYTNHQNCEFRLVYLHHTLVYLDRTARGGAKGKQQHYAAAGS